MPEAFKEKLNSEAIKNLADIIKLNYSDFNYSEFVQSATNTLDTLELKARSNQIKDALFKCLPKDLNTVKAIIKPCLGEPINNENTVFEPQDTGLSGWIMMPVCDYLAELTLDYNCAQFDDGLMLMKDATKLFSSEFAIRLFLLEKPEHTLEVLSTWVVDSNVHVRRLVSEGTRPYLPWGINLKLFAKNPQMIMPLLEKLKDDESEYVRRSVANNLNDIAKDHPDLVANVAKDWWQPSNIPRQKLIKHACRTLLKNGNTDVLACFGYLPSNNLNVSLSLLNESVKQGDNLTIHLAVTNNSKVQQNLLIDYVIYHQKANGKLSPKVFKWTSFKIDSNEGKEMEKNHSFKKVTTRKYYVGLHKVEILINGKIEASAEFQLC